MRILPPRLLVFGVALLLPLSAHAQVDQASYPFTTDRLGFIGWGNSFTPQQNNISGARVFASNPGGENIGGMLRTIVRDDASQTIVDVLTPYSLCGGCADWIGGTWTAVGLNANTLNYLMFVNEVGPENVIFFSAGGNPYAGGALLVTDFFFVSETGHDLRFEEYYDAEYSPTPEPAGAILLLTGLVGVYGVARRRQRQS